MINFIKKVFKIESRGKLGFKNYMLKLAIRFSNNIGFVNKKKEDYLEQKST